MKHLLLLVVAVTIASCANNPVGPKGTPDVGGRWLADYRNLSYSVAIKDSLHYLTVTGVTEISSYLPVYVAGTGYYNYPSVTLNLWAGYPENRVYRYVGRMLSDTTIVGVLTAPARDTVSLEWHRF